MTAITWRNINAPSASNAVNTTNLASNQLDKAFDSARSVVRKFDDHAQQGIDLNTQHFRDKILSQYRSPEALAAAQQSGEIDRLRSTYQTGLDKKRTGTAAVDAIRRTAQANIIKDQTFADHRTNIDDRSKIVAYQDAIAAGDNELALRLAGEVSDLNRADALSAVEAERIKDIAEQRGDVDREYTLSERRRTREVNDFNFDRTKLAAERADVEHERSEEARTLKIQQAALERAQGIHLANGNFESADALNNHFLNVNFQEDIAATDRRVLDAAVNEQTETQIFNQREANAAANTQLAIDNAFKQETGYTPAQIAANPALQNKLSVKQLTAYDEIVKQRNAANINPIAGAQSYQRAFDSLQRQFPNKSATEIDQLARQSQTASAAVNTLPPAVQAEINRATETLNTRYASSNLVSNALNNQEGNNATAVFGSPENLAAFQERVSQMSEGAKAQARKYFGWVQAGEIPVDTFGNKEAIPLTKETAALIANTSSGDGAKFWQFFDNDGQIVENAEKLFANGALGSEDDFKAFSDYSTEKRVINEFRIKAETPGNLVQQLPETSDAAQTRQEGMLRLLAAEDPRALAGQQGIPSSVQGFPEADTTVEGSVPRLLSKLATGDNYPNVIGDETAPKLFRDTVINSLAKVERLKNERSIRLQNASPQNRVALSQKITDEINNEETRIEEINELHKLQQQAAAENIQLNTSNPLQGGAKAIQLRIRVEELKKSLGL